MIRALVFDFDGLILDTETPVLQAWEAIHAEAGVPYSPEHAAKIVGHVDVAFDPWVAFDPSIDRSALDRDYKKRTREILLGQKILPGVETFLREGQRLDLRIAIASNSHHAWVDTHLARLGLSSFFSVVKCRDDVARGKPEPDLYEAVLRDFTLTGREAIAFEDSEAGSLAAKRAGLWCVAVPNPSTQQHSFEHVDLRLNSLADISLKELLARWGSEE